MHSMLLSAAQQGGKAFGGDAHSSAKEAHDKWGVHEIDEAEWKQHSPCVWYECRDHPVTPMRKVLDEWLKMQWKCAMDSLEEKEQLIAELKDSATAATKQTDELEEAAAHYQEDLGKAMAEKDNERDNALSWQAQFEENQAIPMSELGEAMPKQDGIAEGAAALEAQLKQAKARKTEHQPHSHGWMEACRIARKRLQHEDVANRIAQLKLKQLEAQLQKLKIENGDASDKILQNNAKIEHLKGQRRHLTLKIAALKRRKL